MIVEQIKAYWQELNEMYDLNLELPEELLKEPKNFKYSVQFDMAMGKSFDAAVQDNM